MLRLQHTAGALMLRPIIASYTHAPLEKLDSTSAHLQAKKVLCKVVALGQHLNTVTRQWLCANLPFIIKSKSHTNSSH